jgi:TetR/AcrR family transcriptional regulator, transcriptional repressor for nem operon
MDCIVQKDSMQHGDLSMARTREFDAQVVLDRAMEIFWTKGYEATSLDDLCDATGLSRSSLYAAFGSKRNLLLRSVDRYVERRAPEIAKVLAQPLPVRDAFAALARKFIDQIVSGAGRRGCFLGNCAGELPRRDRAALARVRHGLARTEATFRAALMRAVAAGELSSDADLDALARFITAGFQGLRLVGKVNSNRAFLEDIATTMLRCLESSTPRTRSLESSREESDYDDQAAPASSPARGQAARRQHVAS